MEPEKKKEKQKATTGKKLYGLKCNNEYAISN